MSENHDLFYCLNNIYNKQAVFPTDAEAKAVVWPVNRFLSMDKDLLPYIAEVSKYIFTLGAKYYLLLYRLVPRTFAQKNKYLKPEKMESSELLDKYCRYFQLSKREVSKYLEILKKQVTEKELYDFVGLTLKEE